jgi:hypothetical protein
MRLILLEKGWEINATQDEKYLFAINIASGKMEFNEISNWIKSKAIRTSNH